MSSGINTIQAANNGITAITKLVQSAQALASQAQQTTDTTVRAALPPSSTPSSARSTSSPATPASTASTCSTAEQRQPDAHAERKRLVDRHHQRGRFHRNRPRARQLGQQLGDHGRHHAGQRPI